MILVKNLGIDIPAAVEKRDRKHKPPCLRKDNWRVQAQADFAMYRGKEIEKRQK